MENKGFTYQQKAIQEYKNKNYKLSLEYFILSSKLGFYSPGGLQYFAKLYRKNKDYQSEIKILIEGIDAIKRSSEFKNVDLSNLQKRLEKTKQLSNKLEK